MESTSILLAAFRNPEDNKLLLVIRKALDLPDAKAAVALC